MTKEVFMQVQKLSISLPQNQYEFIENYQAKHHYKTRSEVIKEAIRLLQQAQLEAYYQEASQEIDNDFDVTSLDGIEENETW
jgi:antitoxin ParD1/3/4